jgi:Winged helix-turn-helix domain (DUF2582)
MAKKSAPSTNAKPKEVKKASEPVAAEKTATNSVSRTSSNGVAMAAATGLGNHEIGETAGAVWCYLTEKESTSLSTIKKELNVSSELLLAAVGWLAREDKLEFAISGKTVKISLKS